jgi:hypothetical protein
LTQGAGFAAERKHVKLAKAVLLVLMISALSALVLMPCAADELGDNPRREPNLLVDVSAATINALVQRTVDRVEPVREIIQDTPVCGIGRTLGTVRAELVPDPHRAAVDVILQACLYSQTVGTRSTILIHTCGTTPLEIRRRVVMDDKGIRLFAGPSYAVSSACLLDVTSTMDFDCLAIRMTRRGFENNRPAAEAESACKAAARARQRLDEELTPTLTSASETLGRELLGLRRAGLSLEALDFSTTASLVQGRARFATLGRPQPVPVSLPPDIDLAVRIHESVANEAAQNVFGGRSFPVSGVSKVYQELTGGLILDGRKAADIKADLKMMEKVLADLAGKPVTINLPKTNPLIVKFADQGFSLETHIASIRQGKVDYAGLRAKAAYRLENARDGVHAVRKGPVQFTPEPPQPGQKLAKLTPEFQILLETLMAEFVKERVTLAALPMPAALSSRLDPPRAYARNGWFALTWKLAADR